MSTSTEYQPFLESERLRLRPLTEADVDGDYALWLNDPEICAQNSHATFPMSQENLRSFVTQASQSKTQVTLAIELKDGNRHIGNISLQSIQWIARNAELAILIGAKDCWGKGYGAEAATAIVEYGFQRLGLHRIHCGTYSGNAGMANVAAKLGFKEEGLRRQAAFKDGTFLDVIEYGLLADEFGRRKTKEKL
ncbi:MAG: GNAT family protein [Chthoniobacterales bacterium]